MTSLHARAAGWARRLQELTAGLEVPGAVLGVSWRGERVIATAGAASLRSGLPVTPDTLFQLGSISKLYTATLIARLAGSELATLLETPVAHILPEAAWLGEATRVGHLLEHSSGLGGDCFVDTGRGDDALRRYVSQLRDVPRDVPGAPGERYSYCNSGYAVLGRIVEVLTGAPFHVTLRERLLDPLGATRTAVAPEEVILHPVAVGHNRSRDTSSGPQRPLSADRQWGFARALDPVGNVCASAGDLLSFAELHLAGGRAPDGAELLAPGVAEAMRRPRLDTPPLGRPSARGIGFGIYAWRGGAIVGHDGETLGQIAKLRLVPGEQLAVCVLTNAIPDGGELCRALEELVLAPWGLTPPVIERAQVAPTVDATPYLGRYRNLTGTLEVTAGDGRLWVESVQEAPGLSDERERIALIALGDGAFVRADDLPPTRAVRFADPDARGRCRSYFDGRVAWRVAEG